MFSAILLGSIKVPYEEIKRRIIEIDDEHLDVAQIEQLIKYMPEPEQMKQLAGLKDEYDTLSEPEQFAVVVSAMVSTALSCENLQLQTTMFIKACSAVSYFKLFD